MSRLIINADDFGASHEINAAVIAAHLQGVLTSASLMVTGEAAEEAVDLARQTPTLAVGLHLVLAGGRPALPAAEIPRLVNHAGIFESDPVRAGARYFFRKETWDELEREMTAQLDLFAATGLGLSHVDGHMHFHTIPPIFARLLPLARQYGAYGVRIPRDDLGRALPYNRRRMLTKTVWAAFFYFLNRRCGEILDGYDFCSPGRVYGLFETGGMNEAYVLGILENLDAPTAEMYFHPADVETGIPLGPNPGDLRTLLSPEVRRVIEARHIELTTYPDLKEC